MRKNDSLLTVIAVVTRGCRCTYSCYISSPPHTHTHLLSCLKATKYCLKENVEVLLWHNWMVINALPVGLLAGVKKWCILGELSHLSFCGLVYCLASSLLCCFLWVLMLFIALFDACWSLFLLWFAFFMIFLFMVISRHGCLKVRGGSGLDWLSFMCKVKMSMRISQVKIYIISR